MSELITVVAAAGKAPKIDDLTQDGVTVWAEGLLDEYEAKGKRLTVGALLRTAGTVGLDDEDTKKVQKLLKRIYAKELAAETVSGGSPPPVEDEPEPEPKQTPVKEKKVTTIIDASPVAKTTKTNGKVPAKTAVKTKTTPPKVPAKAEIKGQPGKPKNGKTPKTAGNPATKKAKTKAPSAMPVYTKQTIKNKTSIPVEVNRTESGKGKVTIYGHAMRGWLRSRGAKKWSNEDTIAVMNKMGLTEDAQVVGGTMSLTSVINDHLNSGRKGENGWHGGWPKFSKDQEAAFEAVRKQVAGK